MRPEKSRTLQGGVPVDGVTKRVIYGQPETLKKQWGAACVI
jgi:hypothetical protein